MATYTDNYKLVKPQPYDYYDVRVGNRNLDAIDRVMAELRGENERLREELLNKVNKDISITWTNLDLLNGYEAGGTPPAYCKDSAGWVTVSGLMRKPDDSTPSERISILPFGFRPSRRTPIMFMQPNGGNNAAWCTYGYIETNGYIMLTGASPVDPANMHTNNHIGFHTVFKAAI